MNLGYQQVVDPNRDGHTTISEMVSTDLNIILTELKALQSYVCLLPIVGIVGLLQIWWNEINVDYCILNKTLN